MTDTPIPLDPRDAARQEYDLRLGWAIGEAEHKVDPLTVRADAARQLSSKHGAKPLLALWRGVVDSVAKGVERRHEIDPEGQLHFGAVIRTDANVLVPIELAIRLDWVAYDALREAKYREHVAKRRRERRFVKTILARYDGAAEDATTYDVAPDLFPERDEGDDAEDEAV